MRPLTSQVAAIAAVGMLASGIVAFAGTPANAAAGDPDTTFNENVSAVNQNGAQRVASTAVQPDGKVIAVGRDTTGPGNGISRYNPDGTPDVAFNNQARRLNLNSTAFTVAVQADGKILLGGQFGAPPGLLRLNPDGNLDRDFRESTRGLIDGGVWDIKVLPSGKILIGGAFENLNGALGSKYFARLNSNGTPDLNFNANVDFSLNLNDWVQEIAVQENGSVLLAGFFQDPGTSSYLARVNPDGTRDVNFSFRVQQSFNNSTESVTLQPDGKILVAGHFSTPSPMLARYNSDGTPDANFNNAVTPHLIANEQAYSVRALPNGILLGGDFRPGEAPTPYLTAFTYDGEPANAYNDRISADEFNKLVQWITEEPDGAVVVGGDFTTPSRYLARFQGDPPIDPPPPLPPLPGSTAPDKVTDLKAKKYTKKLKLKWKEPNDNGGAAITNYQAKIKKNGNWKKWKTVEPVTNKKGKYTKIFKKLNPDRKYPVKVRAVNEVGNGKAVKKKFKTK
ncbi:MAG: fibronectin type III domain-containing protein [Actinomycetia bacterium]|nr:fibronectin type III domain-containing protein [Actinomycetes bacterium]MCH9801445.1 fibronectin type III domain-containing protein [Actinomycetes bacterium]